jgi:hypothetical protein
MANTPTDGLPVDNAQMGSAPMVSVNEKLPIGTVPPPPRRAILTGTGGLY